MPQVAWSKQPIASHLANCHLLNLDQFQKTYKLAAQHQVKVEPAELAGQGDCGSVCSLCGQQVL